MNILISGASGDIGLSLSNILSKEHNLYLMGFKSIARLDEFRDNKNIFIIEADINDYDMLNDKLGRLEIDVFIHLAAKSYFGLIQDMSICDWNDVISTNLSSFFYITKIVLPNMIRKKNGKIIAISSIWGKVGASMEVAYSTSKGAIDTFVKAAAKELAPSNIAVNSINLGLVDTRMNNHLSNEELESLCSDIPFGRAATCNECSEFIKKIMEMPSYFTGQNIGFDGAW